jgi:hypothetical protein
MKREGLGLRFGLDRQMVRRIRLSGCRCLTSARLRRTASAPHVPRLAARGDRSNRAIGLSRDACGSSERRVYIVRREVGAARSLAGCSGASHENRTSSRMRVHVERKPACPRRSLRGARARAARPTGSRRWLGARAGATLAAHCGRCFVPHRWLPLVSAGGRTRVHPNRPSVPSAGYSFPAAAGGPGNSLDRTQVPSSLNLVESATDSPAERRELQLRLGARWRRPAMVGQ